MKLNWKQGPPTEPGRYDIKFVETPSQHCYNFISIDDQGICQVKGDDYWELQFSIGPIAHHFGPIPEPPEPPEPLKPFRRFNVTGISGRRGTGSQDPNEGNCVIAWEDGDTVGYSAKFFPNLDIEWIDDAT